MIIGLEETMPEKRKDFTGVKNKDLTKVQVAARKRAQAGNYTDRDLNGVPDVDELDWNVLGEDWKWVQNLMLEVDEIRLIVEKAVAEYDLNTTAGITAFINDIRDSVWWQENNQYARDAFALRTTDPAAYAERLKDARNYVQQQAQAIGATLDNATIDRLAERTVVDGWDQQGREYLLRAELVQRIGVDERGQMFGVAGRTIGNLRQVAARNGLTFDDSYYQSAARSVAQGLTDDTYWERQIREQAASYWPAYSEQINAGLDAMSLASGYINLMARTLEIDPNSISLNDPYIRKATTMLDESGKPRPMSLWEFAQDLRNDPRWMNTDQAVKSISDISTGILERFGIL